MAKLKGLGRGLDALLSTVESDNERLTTLPVSSIRPGKYQPRSHMDETALAELAASIRSQGLIQPIVVREIGLGDYELIAGERRWRASQLAGLTDGTGYGPDREYPAPAAGPAGRSQGHQASD